MINSTELFEYLGYVLLGGFTGWMLGYLWGMITNTIRPPF